MTANAQRLKTFLSHPEWSAAACISLVIVWLHFFFLFHAGGLWRDEVNVINLADTHSLSFMTRDSFPVLLPLLVSAWTAMGLAHSDFNLRLLGLLIGLGMTGALWLAAWTARRAPPLLSLTLLGMNGTVIFWGDSLRAFGLGSLLIMLTLAAMCFFLGKPTWWRAGILSLLAALSVQALYQNAVFFAGIGLGGWMICWLRRDTGAALKIFAAAWVSVISLLPYWPCILSWQQAAGGIRPGFSFVAASGNFNTMTAFPLPQYVWIWKLLGLMLIGLGAAAFFRLPQSVRSGNCMTPAELQMFAGTTLLATLGGYFIFLYFAALITSPWYFLPLMALGAICFDLGLPLTTVPRSFRAAVWGILIGTIGLAIPFAARDLNCRLTNMDLVVKRLMKESSPQDYVVVTPWYLGISFDRYYKGAAAWDTLPPVTNHSTHHFDLVPTTATEKIRVSQPILDRIAGTLQTGHRVWIVGWMSVPVPGRAAATTEGRFIAEHSRSFESLDLKIKGQISDYEDVSLLLASGSKTNFP